MRNDGRAARKYLYPASDQTSGRGAGSEGAGRLVSAGALPVLMLLGPLLNHCRILSAIRVAEPWLWPFVLASGNERHGVCEVKRMAMCVLTRCVRNGELNTPDASGGYPDFYPSSRTSQSKRCSVITSWARTLGRDKQDATLRPLTKLQYETVSA